VSKTPRCRPQSLRPHASIPADTGFVGQPRVVVVDRVYEVRRDRRDRQVRDDDWRDVTIGGGATVAGRGASASAKRIVPTVLQEMLKDHESPKAQRAMEAMLRMQKIERVTA
jgi:hypothetical protein